MKVKIEYESMAVMPGELRDLFGKYEESILQYNGERDKIMCLFANMRRRIFVWVADNMNEEASDE